MYPVRYTVTIWSHKSRYKTWGIVYKKPKDLSVSEREEREFYLLLLRGKAGATEKTYIKVSV